MAVASSLQTMPSQMERMVPASHPSMHCGPPMAAMMRGMGTNGPKPTMLVMLSAVASSRPRPRTRPYFFLISKCLSLIAWFWRLRSSFRRTSYVLDRHRPAFAIGALGGCGRCYGLAAIKAVYLRVAIGQNGSNEVAHFVQVPIGEAHKEMIHNIGSRAGGRQHHLRSLLQIAQHDGALRADDLGADVVPIHGLHVIFDGP